MGYPNLVVMIMDILTLVPEMSALISDLFFVFSPIPEAPSTSLAASAAISATTASAMKTCPLLSLVPIEIPDFSVVFLGSLIFFSQNPYIDTIP